MSTDPIATRPPAADEQTFTTTVVRHRDELQRHCVRLTGSPADAEDALQETLLRAWRARAARTSACPRAWLYRIATNVCFDVRARRDSTVASLSDDTAVAEPAAGPEQQPDAMLLARESLELALLTAIQHLPPRQRATFVLRDVLSWSADEAATALSTSVPATNSALQRARSGLRARLAPSRLDWACGVPAEWQRETLGRYLSAIEAADTDTAARLVLGEGVA